MDKEKIIEGLSPLERKVLPLLSRINSVDEIIKESGLQEVEVIRALQWLKNKDLLEVESKTVETICFDKYGEKYSEEGLPEKKFLKVLEGKSADIKEIAEKAGLEFNEASECIGILKKKAAISVNKGVFSITEAGKSILEKEWLEEKLISKLKKSKELQKGELEEEEIFAFNELSRRKGFLLVDKRTSRTVTLNQLGEDLSTAKIDQNIIESLTQEMLIAGSWKDKKFRRYDVKSEVPSIDRGKRHFVRSATDYAKKVWMDMGFVEMEGPLLTTSFWNFDALFTPQDHPAREMQDTFFIKNPQKGSLPKGDLVRNVKSIHEEGGSIESRGWGGKWSEEEAARNVLRTHTTMLSAIKLAKLKESDLPVKLFSVSRVCRNEAMDWSHLFEFNQSEGIVIDPNANFRHLLGYLKEFFAKMGFPKARFRPAHFPYTEPSVEIDVYHPVHKKWLELGGAGVFRPELVIPLLGKDIPVLAWGPGFDRIIMDFYKITDLRDLYRNDIKQIRDMKEWMK